MDYKQLIQKYLQETEVQQKSEVTEQDTKMCKICNQMKKRILAGKFDYKNKKWVDETGKLWNGRICPSCQNNSAKINMQKLRNKDE